MSSNSKGLLHLANCSKIRVPSQNLKVPTNFLSEYETWFLEYGSALSNAHDS